MRSFTSRRRPSFWRRARLSNPSAQIVPRLTRCPPPPSKEQMARRLWLGVGALALGAAMLVAAQLANASRGFRQGGTLQLGIVGASAQIDPQLAYTTTSWWLEYATAAKLFNYPDRRGAVGGTLRPPGAPGLPLAQGGR